ncbi:hypothetical protein HU200_012989 [Digitaria exilis]|uniref:Uncharacterized protein n=1 Tax=Digitaria exilis TaxID=1010633 RepID=A0A835KLE7_9POAL|nr:hypothetical protein HU200_012989 [Digitaria exilis]
MPSLHSRKWCPISFSVPGPDEDGGPENDVPGSCLYIMEKFMEKVTSAYQDQGQFEGFIHTSSETSFRKSWYRHSLPPPPYVLDPGYQPAGIHSQAVLGGGSHLCISALGHGTYCFDTASREWSHAGDLMLPINGMADDIWRIHYPPDWDSYGITNVISLGAGRFCIVKFFETMQVGTYCFGEPVVDDIFAVFTGVELLPSRAKGDKLNGNGKCKWRRGIRMVQHMSKVHVLAGYTTIEVVF